MMDSFANIPDPDLARRAKEIEWEADAREIYRHAKEEAVAIGDEYVATIHLLLAALANMPVSRHGITALSHKSVRAASIAMTARSPDMITLTPFAQTPRFKLAIERATFRALGESRAVSCRDIWFGMLEDPESDVAKTLDYLGVSPDEVGKALT
jgi:ATP-dependent Clp protease ATP-binding subunit ClpA